jgi:hypothetical protein
MDQHHIDRQPNRSSPPTKRKSQKKPTRPKPRA